MAGVDRSDQLTSYYSCPRKTIRWYKKIIFHLLDITVLNSFILYNIKATKKITMADFRIQLMKSLLHIPADMSGSQLRVPNSLHDNRRTKIQNIQGNASNNGHFPEKIPLPSENYKRNTYFMNCRQCCLVGNRSQTSWRCKGCAEKPPLCPGCFEEFHSA